MQRILLVLAIISLLSACKLQRAGSQLDQLSSWMSGTFTSAEQAVEDTSYFDISLVMYPIWEGQPNVRWLYVEQAVSAAPLKPYRQRVYELRELPEGKFSSKVYELPGAKRFIHAWQDPAIFASLNPDSLIVREGCTVFLESKASGYYTGSTPFKDCLSSLYGASYATSEVSVYEDKIVSWDRGWDEDDQQVWGAEKGGYIFKKVAESITP